MPQKEKAPSGWTVQSQDEGSVSLRSTEPAFDFTLETLQAGIFRITFTSDTHPLPPHPAAQAPRKIPNSGRQGVQHDDLLKIIDTDTSKVRIEWRDSSSSPRVTAWLNDGLGLAKRLHSDLPGRPYVVDGDGIAHYSTYNKDWLYVGLGEKAAPMNLAGRRFELSATDSFGYDVYRTDPLYKNIPLLITATPDGCCGLFSTSLVRGSYSIGAEMDGLWGKYKVYRQDYGGLEEYLIIARTVKEVVKKYAEIVGYPLLVPRWAFGYLSGGMKYSMLDDPPANEALLELARKMKQHDIPCSAYQMSSGYTVAETHPKTRNVFTWNRHRFPDPEAFIKEYHKLGMRLIANVKPYVLANHPEYGKLKAANAFFVDPHTKKTAVARLWSAGGGESAEGGHIDFTSAAGFKWWYDGVKKLREQGIDCIWNDNNEYTISDDDWICALDESSLSGTEAGKSRPQVGFWGRNLHTELQGKASHDALVDHDPSVRPFVLTRSATASTMRYACSSWSGDNTTSWESMKGSNALALNAGVSLLHCYGHDIGGFEGPQPSAELLLRWVQMGTYSQRFAINCFKTLTENNVGDVIEPWMYPEITPLVRKAIKRRYAMIPYLYSLMLKSHKTAEPPQRWTGWGYESDAEVWKAPISEGETQYWLGESLLVGGVFEAGATQARMYLPKASEDDEGYVNLKPPYQTFAAGQWVTLDAEWHGAGIPVLAKIGTALPIGKDVQVLSPGEKENPAMLPLDNYRAVEIFPPRGDSGAKVYETVWYEDDGVAAVQGNKVSAYTISYHTTTAEVNLSFSKDESSGFVAPWGDLVVILPVGDIRTVTSSSELVGLEVDEHGRRLYRLRVR